MDSEQTTGHDSGVSQPRRGQRADRYPSVPLLAASLAAHAACGSLEALALCGPMALLLGRHLRFDAADPLWPDRDRVVLAHEVAGIGVAATGLLGAGEGMFHAPGQALGTGVGLAVAERMLAARFGHSLVDHRCWVFESGAALPSGAVQEAAFLAGSRRLGRLTVIARVPAADAPGLAGFAAAGWSVRRAALADAGEVAGEMAAALRSLKPTVIACIGEGAAASDAVGSDRPCPDAAWAACGARGTGARRAWLKRLARHAARQSFEYALSGRLVPGWQAPLAGLVSPAQGGCALVSTAEAVRRACAALGPVVSAIGSPACGAGPGLPAEQNSDGLSSSLAQADSAAMTGMGLHGGFLPLALHRLDDVERVRPALADASRAGVRAIQILVETATPCPVAGRRAGLRAMRNLVVFRPADAAEALECLEWAIRRTGGPSVLLLSEERLPSLPDRDGRTRVGRGGHVIAEFTADRDVTLIASGPELRVALAARSLLAESGIAACVVSLPCWDFFAAQDPNWQARVLGSAPRVGMERGSGFGWDKWLGETGLFVSLAPWLEGGIGAAQAPDGRQVAAMVARHLGHLGPQAN